MTVVLIVAAVIVGCVIAGRVIFVLWVKRQVGRDL